MAPGQGDGPGPATAARSRTTTVAVGGQRACPGPGSDRPRLPPPRPAARPAHPGPGRRLLRPGRPQGAGRPRTAPPARPPRRGRRAARSIGWTAEVADPARRAWLRAQLVALRDPRPGAGRRDAAVPRARRALLRAGAGPPRRGVLRARPRRSSMRSSRARATWRDRLAAWDDRIDRPAGSLAGSPRLAGRRSRDRAGRLFGLPAGEDLRSSS